MQSSNQLQLSKAHMRPLPGRNSDLHAPKPCKKEAFITLGSLVVPLLSTVEVTLLSSSVC
jgi:hypothetical protein